MRTQWQRNREKGLHAWLVRRLRQYGDTVEQLEAAMIAALNAPSTRPLFGVPSGAPRIYDGSTWEDNPHVEPQSECVCLPFPSSKTAG